MVTAKCITIDILQKILLHIIQINCYGNALAVKKLKNNNSESVRIQTFGIILFRNPAFCQKHRLLKPASRSERIAIQIYHLEIGGGLV